jgi:hypothetical protein
MLLNKDINKIIFNFLKIPEKFNFHKLCLKENLEELQFTHKTFDNLFEISINSWVDIIIDNENELSEEFIELYKNKIDWYIICIYQKFSDKFIERNYKNIQWDTLVIHKNISKYILNKFSDNINWELYSTNPYLNEYIIDIYHDKFNWNILQLKNSSNKFIQKYIKKINWTNITFDDLNRYSLYKDYVDWEMLSYHKTLTEDFIIKHEKELSWESISGHQKLSSEFIKKYKHKLNMNKVFFFQKMREKKISSLHLRLPPLPMVRQRRFHRYIYEN